MKIEKKYRCKQCGRVLDLVELKELPSSPGEYVRKCSICLGDVEIFYEKGEDDYEGM